MNIFSNEFTEEQIAFLDLDLDLDFRKEGVFVTGIYPMFRCDDYLNVNMGSGIRCPMMKIDGVIWMSMTRMEVQSNWVPIQLAEGESATLGLGLGYAAMAMAAKPNVSSVDVYENNTAVIEWANQVYRNRPEWRKIRIIHGDARQTLVGKSYDYVYSDIYPELLDEDAIKDVSLFCDSNDIGLYRWWTQEKLLIAAVLEHRIRPTMLDAERKLLSDFLKKRPERDMYQSIGWSMEDIMEAYPFELEGDCDE